MTLVAFELSDAGILVGGGSPPALLPVDGRDTESPGFALAEKKKLFVGKEAERRARLYPHAIRHRFWDRLSTDPLTEPLRTAGNNAEIAYEHLSMIWNHVKDYGNSAIICVPASMDRRQIGLILGMAQELAIDVKGMMVLALAAAPHPFTDRSLFHLDLHLHKVEITPLLQGQHLIAGDTLTLDEMGQLGVYRIWVEAIAEEFVRTTRFDPLHKATVEQELYDRLPTVLRHLSQNTSLVFDMRVGNSIHHITLTRDFMVQKAGHFFKTIREFLDSAVQQDRETGPAPTLLMSHRFARLPGIEALIDGWNSAHFLALEPGAGALGALKAWPHLERQTSGRGTSFFTTRPWFSPPPTEKTAEENSTAERLQPTHLLYRSIAYPITESPLYLFLDGADDTRTLRILGDPEKISPEHCSIRRNGARVELIAESPHDTFIDGKPVTKTAVLSLGQIIRLGDADISLHLIACVERDET
jgi:hypothetical protein